MWRVTARWAGLATVVLALLACGGNPDHLSARIDGRRMDFPVNANAQVGESGGRIVHVVFAGWSSSDQSKPAIGIDVQAPGIVPGAYGDYLGVGANYYWQAPGRTRSYSRSINQPFVVTFTRVDGQRIEGTFAGEVEDPETDEVVRITDGRFSLTTTGG